VRIFLSANTQNNLCSVLPKSVSTLLATEEGTAIREKLIQKLVVDQKTNKQISLAPFILQMEKLFSQEGVNLATFVLNVLKKVKES
jgi:hypothetical protein